MTEWISFPHLGITMEKVGRGISIFGFEIAYYGILAGFAVLAGAAVTVLLARNSRQNPEDYLELTVVAGISGIVGARIYYVLFSLDQYKGNILGIFRIRQGGLAIYGGIAAAVAAAFVFARVRGLKTRKLLDTSCIGLAVGQTIGIWGNFFNRESFGEYTDSLFAMKLPLDAVRTADVTDRMRNHIEIEDGVRFIQAHPTFLYESLWCLVLAAVLFAYHKNKKFEGELFLMYLGGYGLGRLWIEGLRTDSLLMPVTGWKISQVLSVILVAGSIFFIVYGRLETDRNRMRRMREKNARKQNRPNKMYKL